MFCSSNTGWVVKYTRTKHNGVLVDGMRIDSFLFRLVRNPVSTWVRSPAVWRHVIQIWRNAEKIIFDYFLRNVEILSYFLPVLVSVRSEFQRCLCKILLVVRPKLLPFAGLYGYSIYEQRRQWLATGLRLLSAVSLGNPAPSCISTRKCIGSEVWQAWGPALPSSTTNLVISILAACRPVWGGGLLLLCCHMFNLVRRQTYSIRTNRSLSSKWS